MTEKIIVNKTLLALIVRRGFNKKGSNFLTGRDEPLQLGVSAYGKGYQIMPHIHKRQIRQIRMTAEFIYIIKGKLRLSLFLGSRAVAVRILNSGDAVMLMGGHAIKMLAPTKLIEIKQGPYINKESDKRYLRVGL